jgi:NitT/TauT family transport system ATP-binding protein
MSSQYALSVSDLYVDYRSQERTVEAVSGLALEIKRGEFTAVVGPSGCGKTTLLKAIAGLVPVTSGEVVLPKEDRRAPFSMVFQSASLFPWLTVIKNVMYGAQSFYHDADYARQKADEMLSLVGLSDFAKSFPTRLSGGMQQRVNLARALAVDPSLMLLDEPFSSLDAQLRESMQGELARIWSAARTSALLITHQVDEAVFLADRVVVVTARPARVYDVVEVALPRPRRLDMKRTPQFLAYTDEIWRDLMVDDRRDSLDVETRTDAEVTYES